MAITKRLQDEADRTIASINRHYDAKGDVLAGVEEREYRIRSVEDALDGCNGYTEKEKIQKNAETVFTLTCNVQKIGMTLEDIKDEMNTKLDNMKEGMNSKLDELKNSVVRAKDGGENGPAKDEDDTWKTKIVSMVDRHFLAVSIVLIILLSLAFVSGHPDWFTSLLGK